MATPPIHLLDSSINTTRVTVTRDSGGSPIQTFNASLSSVPARIQQVSASEALRYGRESNRRMWKIFVATGQDIVEEDQVSFVDSTTGSDVTRTLQINEIRNPQQAGVIMAVMCEESD